MGHYKKPDGELYDNIEPDYMLETEIYSKHKYDKLSEALALSHQKTSSQTIPTISNLSIANTEWTMVPQVNVANQVADGSTRPTMLLKIIFSQDGKKATTKVFINGILRPQMSKLNDAITVQADINQKNTYTLSLDGNGGMSFTQLSGTNATLTQGSQSMNMTRA